ncbi:SDR family oxidoreductase [Nocardioides carbamazepini]|uniref:short-chain dehydrogenase/reductase n=1 Tax=Nocardioides carbamazepini TaxID=2854259 RepID=UPI002149D38D|nr:short-chain dehydrogenase/reductase [Nocardioides carbamazepini]MCR1783789.1 SDR family oxidoreductase [Nocardioides carbamazepini]
MDLGFTEHHTVLVTGGSRGIGAAIVKSLAEEGVRDIRVVAREPDSLAALASLIREDHGIELGHVALDLSTEAGRAQLSDVIPEVDVLVNNAGAIPQGGLVGADLTAWRQGWDLKVWGYLELTKMALEAMTARGSGVVLNIIGVSGERPDATYVAGSAANAALMTMTRAVGAYTLDQGVRVLGINPGPVETDRLVNALRDRAAQGLGDAERWQEYVEDYPGKRIATPEEVAHLATFLVSPRSAYTSGTVVTLDGGMAWRGRAL